MVPCLQDVDYFISSESLGSCLLPGRPALDEPSSWKGTRKHCRAPVQYQNLDNDQETKCHHKTNIIQLKVVTDIKVVAVINAFTYLNVCSSL